MPEMILCQHEEIAVGMAHGFAKASHLPMAAIVHDVVGLLHSCMAIYYAYIDRAPILVLGATGPMNEAKRRPRIDWIHTANVQGNAVRDYTKWDDQPASVDGIPTSFARGQRVRVGPRPPPPQLPHHAPAEHDPHQRPGRRRLAARPGRARPRTTDNSPRERDSPRPVAPAGQLRLRRDRLC